MPTMKRDGDKFFMSLLEAGTLLIATMLLTDTSIEARAEDVAPGISNACRLPDRHYFHFAVGILPEHSL